MADAEQDEQPIHEHFNEIQKSRPRPGTSSTEPGSAGSRSASVSSARSTAATRNIVQAGVYRPPSSQSSQDEPREQLPPIGYRDDDNHSIESRRISAVSRDASVSLSRQNSGIKGTRLPQIMRFHRETEPSYGADSRQSHKVAFTRSSSVVVSMVTVETQTEWSWLDDMRALRRGSASSTRSHRASARSRPLDTHTERQDEEIRDASPHTQSDSSDSDDSNSKGSSQELRPSGKSRHSKKGESPTTGASVTQVSPPPVDDTYGIPNLEVNTSSSDSDMSDSEADDYFGTNFDPTNLPSIGPPQILQYNREAEAQNFDYEGEAADNVLTDDAVDDFKNQFGGGMFEGICEFCNLPIKPFPKLKDQKTKQAEQLYCCEEYRKFMHFMVTHPLHEKFNVDKLIDISPHSPFGSKQARHAAQERAALRMKEQELAKQQLAMSGLLGGAGAGPTNFYQFARQIKTINYQLSSQKCLEEGWTIRPPSPMEGEEKPIDVYQPQSVLPSWAQAALKTQREGGVVRKFYDNGTPFLIMFEDGTGNVFYPSGRVAISITKPDAEAEKTGLLTYIAIDDTDDRPPVLAMFEPDGHATTYYQNGSIRVCMDQYSGIELDAHGVRKRRWSWREQVQHVHAPPIQPLTYGINTCLAVRIMSQEHITLTFTAGNKSCRFMVGARLKCVAPENAPAPEPDEDSVFREETAAKIQNLFTKVSNLLKFPKSPKLDKLPPPGHLTSRIIKLDQLKDLRKSAAKQKDPSTVVSVN